MPGKILSVILFLDFFIKLIPYFIPAQIITNI